MTSEPTVFISYSSKDSKFVQKLVGALNERRIRTWLDKKELQAGDYLSTRIANAINRCTGVIVILSRNSGRSRWVQYEINQATERAIKGKGKLIPALIDTSKVPENLRGIVYADFRKSFGAGLKAVLNALSCPQADFTRQPKGVKSLSLSRLGEPSFSALVREYLDNYFGTGFLSYGDYGHKDFSLVTIDEKDVLFDALSSDEYSEALDEAWWTDFQNYIQDCGNPLFWLISQRRVAFEAKPVRRFRNAKLLCRHARSDVVGVSQIRVFVLQVSPRITKTLLPRVLKEAAQTILESTGTSSQSGGIGPSRRS